ncbi:succinylglutamate desuccinylase/aspartoacylase domain-containing protein [Burkholderia gladioli]|uniref:succinylglutamate desuccinylase/aspartoacylase domain-containing protein n=1 Tax=Burkholderia gladioli TaxID=28095 RepID=UPI003C7C3FD6
MSGFGNSYPEALSKRASPPSASQHFTPYRNGTLLARDGVYEYVVPNGEERFVFPNPRLSLASEGDYGLSKRLVTL